MTKITTRLTELDFYRPSFDARVQAAKAAGDHVVPEDKFKLLKHEKGLGFVNLLGLTADQNAHLQEQANQRIAKKEKQAARKFELRQIRERRQTKNSDETNKDLSRAVQLLFAPTCKSRKPVLKHQKFIREQQSVNKLPTPSFISKNRFEALADEIEKPQQSTERPESKWEGVKKEEIFYLKKPYMNHLSDCPTM